jgi:DNA-binding beta-propeller fold protein YncE
MTFSAIFARGFSVALVITLAACAGGSSVVTTGANGTPARPYARNGEALLYVSEPALHSVAIYSYPGLRPRAALRGLGIPQGMCVDEATGNVWIVEAAFGNKVVEFPHGGTTPIRSVKVASGLYPDACAVDPTRGDLAVAALLFNDDAGSVLIYRHARGSPASYQSPKMFFYDFVGYDAGGNLFVDGNGSGGGFQLAELAAGASSFKMITPKGLRINHPGGVQFDGSNVAVGAEKRGVIYQISNGVVSGTTTLEGACLVQQFFIDGGQVIAPNICESKGQLLVYNYPAGGAPIAKLNGVSSAFGTVVSR